MQEEPLITIVLVLRKYFHLGFLTLDSILAQETKNYEIIVVEQGATSHDLTMFKSYAREICEVISLGEEVPLSAMMNKALKKARGRYVNFLFPGCAYISKFCQGLVANELQKNNFPEVFYCAYLSNDAKSLPSVAMEPYFPETLKQGKMPAPLHAIWFSKKLLEEIEGFNEQYSYRADFEAICRLQKKDGALRMIHSSRVLVDLAPARKSASEHYQYVKETITVLYRHFGLLHAFFWWLTQDRRGFFKLGLKTFKQNIKRL